MLVAGTPFSSLFDYSTKVNFLSEKQNFPQVLYNIILRFLMVKSHSKQCFYVGFQSFYILHPFLQIAFAVKDEQCR